MNFIDDIREAASNNAVYSRGVQYYEEGRVGELVKMTRPSGMFEISAPVRGNSEEYDAGIRFTPQKRMTAYWCSCPAIDQYNGACKHVVALGLKIFREELSGRKGSDQRVLMLLDAYASQMLEEIQRERSEAPKAELAVEVHSIYRGIMLQFRFGANRLYIVRDIREFQERMLSGETAEIGKNFVFTYRRENFREDCLPLLDFLISTPVHSTYYHSQNKKFLELSDVTYDRFFELFNGKDLCWNSGSKTETVRVEIGNPPMEVAILKEKKGYYPVRLENPIESMFFGIKRLYLHSGSALYCTSRDFSDAVLPFLRAVCKDGEQTMMIWKDDMATFCVNVLDSIGKFIHVHSEEDLAPFQPPELRSKLFIDLPEPDRAEAKLVFQYGEQEFPAHQPNQRREFPGNPRGEYEAALAVAQYFEPCPDGTFTQYDGEDGLYHLVRDGLAQLAKVCELYVTDRFRRLEVRQPPAISVGVKIAGDLLDFRFDAAGFPTEDLTGVLESYRKKARFHRLRDGSFLDLDSNALAGFSELVQGLDLSGRDLRKGQATLPLYRAPYINESVRKNEDFQAVRDSGFKKIVRDLRDVSDADFEPPKSLRGILRNYQKTGFRWLKTMSAYRFGGILADDMGLGKTLEVIALLLSDREEQKETRVPSLVVSPSSLVLNWQKEIQKFAPKLTALPVIGTAAVRKGLIESCQKYDLVLTSYDMLKRDIELYETFRFGYVILDEAQYIKNHTTQSAKAVKRLGASRRFALTGTPVENSLAELWSIFDFLMPHFLGGYSRFRERFELPIVKSQEESAAETLRKLVSPFILRRLKKDVLRELPEKSETALYAQPGEEERRLYAANAIQMKRELQEKLTGDGGQSKGKLMVLPMLTRLRQICCDPALCYENYEGGSAKLELCMELLSSCAESGHKTLLFSQFTSMLDILRQRLEQEGISYYLLQGSTAKEERLRLAETFNQDGTKVFLISLRAGGTGLNLTGADVVIHYDPWWNLSVQNQATDRAYRIGQKNSVQVYKLIAQGTIEEKILKLQQAKSELSDKIIREGDASLSQMSLEDILTLFD